jgi:hypothetical protein
MQTWTNPVQTQTDKDKKGKKDKTQTDIQNTHPLGSYRLHYTANGGWKSGKDKLVEKNRFLPPQNVNGQYLYRCPEIV